MSGALKVPLFITVLVSLLLPTNGLIATVNRAPAPRMQMGSRRQAAQNAALNQEAKRKAEYEAIAERAEKQKAETAAKLQAEKEAKEKARKEREAKIAYYQDNVDLYRPGGVMRPVPGGVTRDMLQNARKTTSPALRAEERIKEVLEEVGTMPPSEAIELIERAIGEARAVGARDTSPIMKKALQLQGTLMAAAGGETETQDTATTDPQKDAFDALFGGGYAMPNDDDVDVPY